MRSAALWGQRSVPVVKKVDVAGRGVEWAATRHMSAAASAVSEILSAELENIREAGTYVHSIRLITAPTPPVLRPQLRTHSSRIVRARQIARPMQSIFHRNYLQSPPMHCMLSRLYSTVGASRAAFFCLIIQTHTHINVDARDHACITYTMHSNHPACMCSTSR